MQKVLVIGLGLSGKAAAEYLLTGGYEVFGFDDKLSCHNESDIKITLVDKDDLSFLKEFAFVVVSPGVPRNHFLCKKAEELSLEIIGEAELGFRILHKNYPKQKCIAITGTNGKTTVTLLAEHILRYCGIKARALGNIGTPFTSYLQNVDPEEILVCELSSYQLETMTCPVFDSAVIVNITPDHLDRYATMEEYAKSKTYVHRCLKKEGILFVYENCLRDFPKLFEKMNTITYGVSTSSHFSTDKKFLYRHANPFCILPESFEKLGIHESENALAAWCLVSIFGISPDDFISGLSTFTKPSHRIEFVKTIDEVAYYDDSKGTNVDAVIQAVKAMQGPVVLIAGGVNKGFPFTIWKESFMGKVKYVISIGETAHLISQELGDEFAVSIASSLEEAVEKASSIASKGDCVLLSPGCSSFDMFRDYKHRGQEFKRCVADLENRSKNYES